MNDWLKSRWSRLLWGLGLLLVASISLNYTIFLFRPLIPPGPGLQILYSPGAPFNVIVDQLESRHYLTQPWLFKIHLRLRGGSRHLQAGEYYFPPGTTPDRFIAILQTGHVVRHKITLIEGWTLADILAELAKNPNIKHTLNSPQAVQASLNSTKPMEGLFWADTYDFPKGTTDYELLRWSYNLQQNRLQQAWEQRDRDLFYRNPYQALIVASLIEKETADNDERYLIASVIHNRIGKNMYLQIDPSVIYGLYHTFIPVLSQFDLRIDTRYNTYRHKGLPPTPIALVSAASLDAALHPAKTDYLYFVLKSDGKHQFSTSYRQHLTAVRALKGAKRYQAYFKEQ